MSPPMIRIGGTLGSRPTVHLYGGGTFMPPTPFNPDDLNPIRRWRTVSGVTKLGSDVTSWDDTVAGYVMTPPSTNPVYVTADSQFGNKDTFQMTDGASAMVSAANVDYGQFTVFVVAKVLNGAYLYTHNDGYEYWFTTVNDSAFTSGRLGDNSAYNVQYTDWGAYPTPKVYTHRFDGTYAGDSIWVNGIQQEKSSVNAGDPGTSILSTQVSLAGNTGASFGAQGKYAELIIYDYVLTDDQRALVEQWLYNEYALDTDKSCWLRADNGVTLGTGNNVVAWNDISSCQIEPTFTQTDGSTCPQYNASGMGGNPDLSFDGTQFLAGTDVLLGRNSVALFGTFKTTSASAMELWGKTYNGYQYGVAMNPTNTTPGQLTFTVYGANRITSPLTYDDDNPHAFVATYDAIGTGVMNLYVDDFTTPVATATIGGQQIVSTAGDLNAVGAQVNNALSIGFFVGNIGEVGSFDWAIDAATVKSLGSYLKGRVGI